MSSGLLLIRGLGQRPNLKQTCHEPINRACVVQSKGETVVKPLCEASELEMRLGGQEWMTVNYLGESMRQYY